MFRKSALALASVLAMTAFAAPASAAEVKVHCTATAITYAPMTGAGNVPLFSLQPQIVGAACVDGPGDQHLLKIGDADPVAFGTQDSMKKFLSALGRFADDYTKKKTAQK